MPVKFKYNEYQLLYLKVARLLSLPPTMDKDFPDEIDQIIYKVIFECKPTEEDDHIMFPKKLGWLDGPHVDALVRIKLIQAGLLT